MALHKTLDSKDLYPVEHASKIANTLTNGEKRVEETHRWSYVIVADKKQPSFAAVAVYDETNTFVGWWCR
jgi:hypothetical protein